MSNAERQRRWRERHGKAGRPLAGGHLARRGDALYFADGAMPAATPIAHPVEAKTTEAPAGAPPPSATVAGRKRVGRLSGLERCVFASVGAAMRIDE